MLILGLEHIQSALAKPHYEAKAVLNQHGIIFFSATRQHRDQKAEGISYEDDYDGNALAAMLYPGRIEIRYHRSYTDDDVAGIIDLMRADASLTFMGACSATYQGRPIS